MTLYIIINSSKLVASTLTRFEQELPFTMPPKRSATSGVSGPKSRSSTGNSTLGRSASGKRGAASKALSTGKNAVVSGLGRAVNRSDSNASSNGYTSEPVISREYSQEELEKVKNLPELDVNDPSWDPYWEVVQEKMGMPESKPSQFRLLKDSNRVLTHSRPHTVHSEGLDRVQLMLRVFDLDPTYVHFSTSAHRCLLT